MFECVLSNNGIRMYFLEGKHVSREYMKAYTSKLGKSLPYCKSITENTKLIRLKKKIIYLRIKLNELLSETKNSNNFQDKDELLKQLTKLDNEVSSLKENLNIEKGRYDKVVKDLKQSFNENERMKQVIADNENKLIEMEKREKELAILINKLETEKNNLEKELSNTNSKVIERTDNTDKLESTITDLQETIKSLKKDLEAEKKLALDALKSNSNNSDLVEQTVNDLNFKLSEYEVMNNTLKEEKNKLQEINSKLLEDSGNNQNMLEERDKQTQLLERKIEEYTNRLDSLEAENLLLKSNEVSKNTELENREKELELLKTEIDALKEDVKVKTILENKKKEMEDVINGLVSTLENKEKENTEVKAELEKDIIALTSILENKEKEKAEVTAELEKDIIALTSILENKEKEKAEMTAELENKEKENINEKNNLEKEILSLKIALENTIKEEKRELEKPIESPVEAPVEAPVEEPVEEPVKVEAPIKVEAPVEEPTVEQVNAIEEKEKELEELKGQLDSLKEDINIVKSDLTPEVKVIEKTIGEQKELLASKKTDINIDVKDIEKVTEDIKEEITRLRNDNTNVYLESLSLNPNTYPILLKIYDNTKTSEINLSGTIPLLLYISKSLLVTTRLFTRNPIFMRLVSLDNEDFKELFSDETLSVGFKEIIEELYYTNIPDDYISESIPELETMVKNKTFYKSKNQLYLGLKSPLYDKLILQILNDSKTGVKRVNTDYFLNTIIKLLSTLTASSEKELKQYRALISLIINIVRNSIQRNENLIKIQNIILQTSNEQLKNYHNKNTNIFTFIRLRSNDVNDINSRFNIKMDQEEKTMFIGYDPTTKALYENNKLVENPRYRDNYIFGPFTKIFKPYLTNKEIADDSKIQLLIERLKNKKPVMIIGYGASGSGKTSTLINFFDKNLNVSNPGIMMYMSDKLQSEYKTIEVSFIELEGDITSDNPIRDIKVIPSKDETDHIYNPQKFVIENGEWVIDKDTFNVKLEDEENKKKGIDIDKNTSLKYYIATILYKARNVKATTNNPESSRSHMLVFVNFINDQGENVYLIICDFAGVENVFNCLNPEVLDKFINIKDRTNNRFYKTLLDDTIKEKIGNTLEEIEKSKKQPLTEADKLNFTATKNKINLTLNGIKEIKRLFLSKNPGKEKGIKDTDKPVRVIDGTLGIEAYKKSKYRTIVNMILEKIYGKIIKEDYLSLNTAIIDLFKLNKDKMTKLNLFENSINLENSKFINLETADLICKNRVKEGLFINDSLEKLRGFISDFIVNVLNKDKSTVYPPFFDSCVPYQCNPYFDDCFGSSNEPESVIKSVIMDKIKGKICDENCDIFNQLNIVVFNVLNLSKEANNAPPIPYTDITGLTTELNRLKTIRNNTYLKDEYFSDDKFVRKVFLDDIENRETIKQYDPTAQKQIYDMISILRETNKSIEQHILNLNKLIMFINRINAVTTIGTMEFTDMIGKFGLNKSTCNYMLDQDDIKPLLVDLPEKIRDDILDKLNTQRTVLLALFDNLFVQSYFK